MSRWCALQMFYKLFKLFSPSKTSLLQHAIPAVWMSHAIPNHHASQPPTLIPKQSGNSERWNGGIEIILTDLGNWWSYGRRIGVTWFMKPTVLQTKLTSKFFLLVIFLCYQLTVYPPYILLLLSTCSFSSFLFENPPSTTHRKSAWRVTTWVLGPNIRKACRFEAATNGLPVFCCPEISLEQKNTSTKNLGTFLLEGFSKHWGV